jgi:hypothetical protein
MEVVSCAAAENALVKMHSAAPVNKPKDREVSLCIKRFPLQENRMLEHRRPLFANAMAKVERVIVNTLAK